VISNTNARCGARSNVLQLLPRRAFAQSRHPDCVEKRLKLTHVAPWLTAIAVAFALPAVAQTAAAPSKKVAKAPAKTNRAVARTPVSAAPAPADPEQKSAAAMAYLGDYACEFDQTVVLASSAKYDGYIDMKHKHQSWLMKPVLSSTGALRLEDVNGRMLMIQIANKSMVMDTKLGQRLVDGCQHEKQRQFAKSMQPQEAILK
jgi:hypothetical protein